MQPPTPPTILPLIAAFQLAAASPTVYNGRAGQTTLAPPRIEADVTIDGVLDEPQWQQAALLTGFSLYQPADQRPAPDSTEVRVWYSSNAIYFGIRAFEPHGAVTATLADRDRISSDDQVEIHLDTFDERNRAIVFIVNPLGVQADGTKSEIGGFIPGSNVMPGQNDLSADYIWQSRGRLTDYGFEVEVRIPFSSLRYRAANVQQWGLQIDRRVQHSGYEETWTPAKRASATFIGQAGRLTGLTGMHHGTVVELNPELTSTVTGAPCCAPDPEQRDWRYKSNPTLGGNVRWTLGSNFVLNGTVKPDFSQVEADATQIAADERFALLYPEKRQFFVEALDQFNVPNSLVYTRTIVRPDAAVKLTGKLARADVAVLSALDEGTSSSERPLVDIVRIRQGFGEQSSGGFVYSDRMRDGHSNRMFGGDTKIVFGKYYAQFQLDESITSENGVNRDGPLWEAVLDRTGRAFGFHYNVIGIDPDFRADNGFVPRVGYVQPNISNRITLYGAPGALFERFNAFGTLAGLWRYHDFFSAKSVLEDRASAMMQVTLRGGWSIGATPKIATYAFDPAAYPGFRPADRTNSFVTSVSVSTPQFRTFAASAGANFGNDVDLLETSRVRRTDYNASLDVRPNTRLRLNATYVSTQFVRRSDDERSAFTRIPRVKIEYQIARPIFVRVVSQYTATNREALRDPRTGEVLLVNSGGQLVPSQPSSSNVLRTDWLFSYRPAPGTVFFVGYGGSLTEPDPLAFQELRRQSDAFFVKLSYVFRN